MVIIKQNISKKPSIPTIRVTNVMKKQLSRTVTPDGIFYVSDRPFYPEAAFVLLNNYLVSPSNYTLEKVGGNDFNAVKFKMDPGANSVVYLISVFK